MHWAISHSDRYFFQENQYVVFEELMKPFSLSKEGRDLFRTDPFYQKLVFNKQFPTLLADLLGKKQLRLAFDQVGLESLTGSFKDNFSVQGLVGAALLHPSGQVLFFDADIPVSQLPFREGLLIGYCQNPVYIHNPQDPYNQNLKSLGYTYGDALKESTHPTLYRY